MFLLELCYIFLSHSGSCLDYKQHNCWKQYSNPGKRRSFLPFWFQMHCVQFTAQCTVCNCMEINGRHLTLGGDGCRSPAAPHRHPRQGTYIYELNLNEIMWINVVHWTTQVVFIISFCFRATSKPRKRRHGRSPTWPAVERYFDLRIAFDRKITRLLCAGASNCQPVRWGRSQALLRPARRQGWQNGQLLSPRIVLI